MYVPNSVIWRVFVVFEKPPWGKSIKYVCMFCSLWPSLQGVFWANEQTSVYKPPSYWIRKTMEAWGMCKIREWESGRKARGQKSPHRPLHLSNSPRFANPTQRLNTRRKINYRKPWSGKFVAGITFGSIIKILI